jgi:mono/diheme cytochrome c family protein
MFVLRRLRFLTLIALNLICFSCAQGPAGVSWGTSQISSSSQLPAASLTNSYESAAIAVIQSNCTSCHGATSGPAGVYDLTDPNNLVTTGLVIPGEPSQSTIYSVISGGTMPPTGSLSAANQLTIYHWISGQ